jgi:hypothetical protein
VWVSKADYAVMRIAGSPAKNPTWMMGSSNFDYRYAQNGDFWLPAHSDTISRLRIGGEVRLTVEYGAYRITPARPLGAVTSAANRGEDVKDLAVELPQ